MVVNQHGSALHGVTVALPVYNEEQILVANITRLREHLDSLGVAWQILIGSNGSTDTTVELARRLHDDDRRVDVFHLPVRGVGLAFREFIRRAEFPLLVSLDMDLSVDLAFVDRALALGGTHDIIVGSKKLAATQRRSLFRKAGSDFFLLCTRVLTGLPYDDYSIGAKAYRVDFLRSVSQPIDAGSSYVLDLCYAAHSAGRPVARVPVMCEDRRTSKFNLAHEAVYKFRRLFELWGRFVMRPAPARRSQSVGAAMIVEKSR
jgi:glycosyltransferase involved in cell wall biosynthesis